MTKEQQEFPSDGEILAVKDVVAAFLTSMRSFDLYPHDHAFSQKFLRSVHNRLDDFLSRYGELKISIEQNSLLYKKVPVYEAQSDGSNFAFMLYRDGLLWIEFLSGLPLEEIKTFLAILNKYKVLRDEPEDDIVSALWEEDLAHIKYEAKELFFGDEPLLDFASLNKVPDGEGPESATEEASVPAAEEPGNILDMDSGEGPQYWWSLSPEEVEKLNEMVAEAEKSERSGDVLQVLFFVLNEQDNAKDFGVILGFLKDEWRSELDSGNFARVADHLAVLKKLKESPQQGREWVVELLATFFAEISAASFLSFLYPMLIALNRKDPDQLARLRSFLLLFEPEMISSLGKLLPYITDKEVLGMLFGVMIELGKKEVSPLRELLANENDLIALGAIQVLRKIKGDEPAELITRSLEHSSAKVRRYALRSCIAAGNPNLDELFKVIDDPNITTRSILLSLLGRGRNEKAEKLLLNYLQREPWQHLDENHIHTCYRTLGLCGSKHSLAFLKKTLLGRGWKSLLNEGKNIQQQGAVVALSRLQIKEATDVLKKGAASLMPGIRKSCRSALAKKTKGA